MIAVAVKVVCVVSKGVIVAFVSPVFQAYVVPPETVSVAFVPEQMVAFPLMFAVGVAATFTVNIAVSAHPLAPTVTV